MFTGTEACKLWVDYTDLLVISIFAVQFTTGACVKHFSAHLSIEDTIYLIMNKKVNLKTSMLEVPHLMFASPTM